MRRVRLVENVLLEPSNDVTSRVVLANNIRAPSSARALGTSHLGGALPDQLGEVSGGLGEVALGVVVVLVLVVPGVDSCLGSRVANGQVLAVRAMGVLKVALGLFEVVGGVLGQSGVPCERSHSVLSPVAVLRYQHDLVPGVEVQR